MQRLYRITHYRFLPLMIFSISLLSACSSTAPAQRQQYDFGPFNTVSLPNTKIYVESVLPFNDRLFPIHYLRTNDNILQLNEGIMTLAEKHNLPYLDITSDFTNENGRLSADLTVDGLHLNNVGYKIWHNNIYDEVKS